MFASQRGNAGLGSIGAVGVVLIAWLIGAGVMLKSYTEGASSNLPHGSTCQVVCTGTKNKG